MKASEITIISAPVLETEPGDGNLLPPTQRFTGKTEVIAQAPGGRVIYREEFFAPEVAAAVYAALRAVQKAGEDV